MVLLQGIKDRTGGVMDGSDGSNVCVCVCRTWCKSLYGFYIYMLLVTLTLSVHINTFVVVFCYDMYEVFSVCMYTLLEYTASCKCCVMWLCNMGLPAGRPHWSMKWSVIGKCVL